MRPLYTHRIRRCLILFALLGVLQGCAAGYYWQAGMGQLRIANGKQSVDALLASEGLAAAERDRLLLSQQALEFAHRELLLPDNGSYRSYYDTGSPYVVWNVFAAPEFALQPRTWCFPVTGCISYRGYFAEDKAQRYASKLAEDGDDVFVGGVTAYSTLGRFHDPILNTMLDMTDLAFVGLLFHELAHQQLYVKNDSAFNEAYATAIEREGMRRWLEKQAAEQRASTDGTQPGQQQQGGPNYNESQRQQVLDLLRVVRKQLKLLYASTLDDAQKRAAKQSLLDNLAVSYEQLVVEWEAAGLKGRPYGGLFARGFNNASLGAVATYDNYVPAFELLLRQCDFSLPCFYAEAETLAALEPNARNDKLREYLAAAILYRDLNQ